MSMRTREDRKNLARCVQYRNEYHFYPLGYTTTTYGESPHDDSEAIGIVK
jgi:hypothetical protein